MYNAHILALCWLWCIEDHNLVFTKSIHQATIKKIKAAKMKKACQKRKLFAQNETYKSGPINLQPSIKIAQHLLPCSFIKEACLFNVNIIQPLLVDVARSSMAQPHLCHCGCEPCFRRVLRRVSTWSNGPLVSTGISLRRSVTYVVDWV